MRRRLLVLAMALGLLAMPLASPVSASPPPVPGTPGFAPPSTAPQAMTAADAEPLQPFRSLTVQGSYVAAGVGMRNRGYGTITLSGIPAGAQVTAAYLFWDVLADTASADFAAGTLDSQPITGTLIGSDGNPCWGNTANFAYRADVTSLVAGNGNGAYALAGFASHLIDGQDPWNDYDNTPPLLEGASLVAVYEDASAAQTQVLLYDGATGDARRILTQTLSGFTAATPVSARTTFIVADGQAVPQSPPTFDGTPLPAATLNGSDPQAGPAYSLNDLWDTRTVDVSGLVRPGDTSASATIDGMTDCHVWVAQVLAVSSSSKLPVLFVHGYSASAIDNNWIDSPPRQQDEGFIHELGRQIGADDITSFPYVQDMAYASSGVCNPPSAALPETPDGGMPYDASSVSRDACDSNSDIGLNAVALDAEVQALHEQTGQRVVLVANSMGGAIVRGFFAYSYERHDGVAASMVDSAFFIEGAHQGALPTADAVQQAPNLIVQLIRQWLSSSGNLPSGPAVSELAPQSTWYKWVNPNPAHVPQVPSFNAYGDIGLAVTSCLFGAFCVRTPVVFYGTVGDGVLMPGSDNPLATPLTGGARYLNGAPSAQNWEWDVRSQVPWDPTSVLTLGPAGAYLVATAIMNSPASHTNMGTEMYQTSVPDCQSGQAISLDSELIRVIEGRVTGQPYQCHS